MNIRKTNPVGLRLANRGFIGRYSEVEKLAKDHSELTGVESVAVNPCLFKHNPSQKIIRVSKSVMEACRMIDIDSIRNHIDSHNFDFQSLFILLDSDVSGYIKAERFGGDISFLMTSNIAPFRVPVVTYNAYNFTSKEFYYGKEDDGYMFNYEKSVFVIQLLAYLIYGEITETFLKPKQRRQRGLTSVRNDSNLNVTFCDTLWKQRINVDGFKVRGHFRLQPCGENWSERKLIWIEEFEKKGYNRKATVEMINNK